MPVALGVYTPRQILDLALGQVEVDGHFLEFGVYRGGTIKYIASKFPQRTIHGFDSFEGLPERWSGYNMDKSTFSLGGRVPKVPSNVKLHPGWFDKSLPIWLQANPGPIAFVHIDCDIYSSTNTIFGLITSRVQPGAIITFDEYFGYPNWRNHEYKAFQEFVQANSVRYEYLAYSRIQVAVKILAIQGASATSKVADSTGS
jgi:hypothetical protein